VNDRDTTYVQHIAAAVRRIDSYLSGLSEEAFCQTPMVQDAVLRNLEVVSEASRRLSEEFKSRYAEIRWKEVAAAGNVYRHEYDRVRDDLVWETATTGLDSLRHLIQREVKF
jgi:uncharacterized protein with HEPN domain